MNRAPFQALGGFGETIGETPTRLTVGELRRALSEFSDDLTVAAVYDAGCAEGRIVDVQAGTDPDDDSPAILLVID